MLEQLSDRALYSYYLEKLNSNLYRRINLSLSAAVIVLGASIFTQIFDNVILGVFIAVISGFQTALKLGEKSEQSRNQAMQYSKLVTLIELNAINETESLSRFIDIEEGDKFTFSALEKSALIMTRAHLNLESEAKVNFSFFEKLIIIISGGKTSV